MAVLPELETTRLLINFVSFSKMPHLTSAYLPASSGFMLAKAAMAFAVNPPASCIAHTVAGQFCCWAKHSNVTRKCSMTSLGKIPWRWLASAQLAPLRIMSYSRPPTFLSCNWQTQPSVAPAATSSWTVGSAAPSSHLTSSLLRLIRLPRPPVQSFFPQLLFCWYCVSYSSFQI